MRKPYTLVRVTRFERAKSLDPKTSAIPASPHPVICRSFPAVRAFRVICPMESSVLFRFATAILRRVTPAPSSPYLHSGLHLKKGDCGWPGTRTPVLISKQQPIFPISLFFSCRHPHTGYSIGAPPFCSMFTYRRMTASAPS